MLIIIKIDDLLYDFAYFVYYTDYIDNYVRFIIN